ncbi:MAG: response regulator [Clostridia bacterium]|nr:response regulator [Clostridia bacterium]
MKSATPMNAYIASGDPRELDLLKDMLQGLGLRIVGTSESGSETVSGVLACRADILVADFLLSEEDGLDVCRRLQSVKNPPVTILLFPYMSGEIYSRLSSAAPDCFLLKPVNAERLLQSISDCTSFRQKLSENRGLSLEIRVSGILRELGIPVKLLGHRYIYDALLSVRDNQLCVRGAMDELYRYIASRHGTTPPRVERNIRNAIEIAFDRCTPEILEKHFGNTVRFDRGKPTNSEFLSIIAEKLTLETRESSDPDRDMFLSRSMY